MEWKRLKFDCGASARPYGSIYVHLLPVVMLLLERDSNITNWDNPSVIRRYDYANLHLWIRWLNWGISLRAGVGYEFPKKCITWNLQAL